MPVGYGLLNAVSMVQASGTHDIVAFPSKSSCKRLVCAKEETVKKDNTAKKKMRMFKNKLL